MFFSITFNDKSRVGGTITKLIVDGKEIKLSTTPSGRAEVRKIFSVGEHNIVIHTKSMKLEFKSTEVCGFNV